MTLGEKIQQLRKDKDLSQEQLALEMKISRQAISKWELGESIPDTNHLIKLSKYFKVSIDYLLHDELEFTGPLESKSNHKKEMVVIAMAAMMIGLILSIVFWITYQSIILTSLGLILQVIAWIVLIVNQSSIERKESRLYYVLGTWFTLFFPCLFLVDVIMNFYPRPRLGVIDFVLGILLYLVIGISITRVIKHKKDIG